MSISLRKLGHESVSAHKLVDALRFGEYAYCKPGVSTNQSIATTGAPAAGTDATWVNGIFYGQGNMIPYSSAPIATATILQHYYVNGFGVDLCYDATDDEGSNGIFGGYNLQNPWRYVIGTDLGAFIKVTVNIPDVSGTDDFCIGWRKYEDKQPAVDDYDEMAAFNINTGNVLIETILNGAATSTTDTTADWADTESHTLEVQFIGRQVLFYYDDVIATAMPDYLFDTAEVVVPFWYFLNTAHLTPAYLTDIEIGPLSAVTASGLAQ